MDVKIDRDRHVKHLSKHIALWMFCATCTQGGAGRLHRGGIGWGFELRVSTYQGMEKVTNPDDVLFLFDDKCLLNEEYFDEYFGRELLYTQLLNGFIAYNRALELNPIVSKFKVYRQIVSNAIRILQSNTRPLSESDVFDALDDTFDLSFKHLPHLNDGHRDTFQNDASEPNDTVYDGDDITTMSLNSSTARNPASLAPQSLLESADTLNDEPADPTDLHKVRNVIVILGCMFYGFSSFNKSRAIPKNGTNVADILILLLRVLTQNSNDFWLVEVFKCIRFRFHEALKDADLKPPLLPISFSIISETLGALERILEAVNSSFVLSQGNPNHIFAQSLLSACVQVDFAPTFEALLALTVPTRLENGHSEPPKLTVSVSSLSRFTTVLAFLLATPDGGATTSDLESSADITNTETGSKENSYNDWLIKSAFDQNELTQHFKLLLGLAFKALYGMDPDLMTGHEPKSWLTGWFLGTRSYNSVNVAQDMSFPGFNHKASSHLVWTGNPQIEESHHKASSSVISTILPITIILRVLIKDPDFTAQLVSFQDPGGSSNNLLEQWLCVLSYVFTYQYKSRVFQSTATLAIEVLIEMLNSSNSLATDDLKTDCQMTAFENLSHGLVDEYKWKLCHQKMPIILLFLNKTGFKPCVFYILDVCQSLLRYNLTNKINLTNYSMSMNLVFLVVNRVKDDENQDIKNYQWPGLFAAIFAVLKFVWKQHNSQSKHLKSRTNEVWVLMEEILIVINEMLKARYTSTQQVLAETPGGTATKPIAYSLVYNLLLHYQLATEILAALDMAASPHLHMLINCLNYFEDRFHMTEASKASHATHPKVDLFDYDIDSHELEQHLMAYFETTTAKPSLEHVGRYQYPATMQYLRSQARNGPAQMTSMSCLFYD